MRALFSLAPAGTGDPTNGSAEAFPPGLVVGVCGNTPLDPETGGPLAASSGIAPVTPFGGVFPCYRCPRHGVEPPYTTVWWVTRVSAAVEFGWNPRIEILESMDKFLCDKRASPAETPR